MRIALAGNPNSGKTTLFNELTGSRQYVGNWPGVTVEKKEGKLKKNKEVIITDLPGIYSLSPYTPEEVVTRNHLTGDKPDAIINIVDATAIEHSLLLTTQLCELEIPMVIALNMSDIIDKNNIKVDINKLSKKIGCPVILISAIKRKGIDEVAAKAIEAAKGKQSTAVCATFTDATEKAFGEIKSVLDRTHVKKNNRFFLSKLYEKDRLIYEDLELSDGAIKEIESISGSGDTEGVMTQERYNYIKSVIADTVSTKKVGLSTTEKVDKVLTNKWAAFPIFALVMFLIYYISVSTLGGVLTDWANDGVFGDGWHLFGIGSGEYDDVLGDYEIEAAKIEGFIAAAEEEGIDVEDIKAILEEEEPDQSIIDSFLAATAGLAVSVDIENEDGEVEKTLVVNNAEFSIALEAEEPDPAEYGVWVPGIPVLVEGLLDNFETAEWVDSLILDGIIGGVGAVLGFVPQIIILFILLSLLEDCGYMARVAFILDRLFRGIGLSGKSFIPMLIGTGCGVPGIMAAKTIENENDRRMTVMTTTFMPCAAKLPVIALIAAAFFPDSALMAPIIYFMGIFIIIISGLILKKTRPFMGNPSPFIMEMPKYHIPALKQLAMHVWERVKSFIVKAGTVIFISSALIWFTLSFGFGPDGFGMVDIEDSMLAAIGKALAVLFKPIGFGSWGAAVATITGLIAKEQVVSTVAIVLGMSAEATESDPVLLEQFAEMIPTAIAAFSFLVFNLFSIPCFAAVGAIRREMHSAKWTAFALCYQIGTAYALSLIIYQLGGIIFTDDVSFSAWTIIAAVVLLGILFMIFRPASKPRDTQISPSSGKKQKASV